MSTPTEERDFFDWLGDRATALQGWGVSVRLTSLSLEGQPIVPLEVQGLAFTTSEGKRDKKNEDCSAYHGSTRIR